METMQLSIKESRGYFETEVASMHVGATTLKRFECLEKCIYLRIALVTASATIHRNLLE